VNSRRHFTRDEAERLLPQVEQTVREIVAVKEALEEAERVLRAEAERISLSGGAFVNAPRIASVREQRQGYASRLQEAVETVHRHGCLLKDLDLGLLDFPTLLRGEEVYLCWKLGEPRIEFWHGIEEGYRGRKPIDAEFLENHAGG
jgi:hypothetical protein